MTLLSRLTRFTTGGPYTATSGATRADLAGQGYAIRHTYPVADRCPYCAGRLTREEWGQPYTATIGMDVCSCGYVSQQRCIA